MIAPTKSGRKVRTLVGVKTNVMRAVNDGQDIVRLRRTNLGKVPQRQYYPVISQEILRGKGEK